MELKISRIVTLFNDSNITFRLSSRVPSVKRRDEGLSPAGG
jgi:hypothetical protein